MGCREAPYDHSICEVVQSDRWDPDASFGGYAHFCSKLAEDALDLFRSTIPFGILGG